MKNYCIKQEDLKGPLEGFPLEVVKAMIEEQVRQGNEPNIEVFQENADQNKRDGGFDWPISKNGYDFWKEVIEYADFKYFFENYKK